MPCYSTWERTLVILLTHFDVTMKSSPYLPALLPNLPFDGFLKGIAVGMATKIPPHNLFSWWTPSPNEKVGRVTKTQTEKCG